MTGGPGRGLAGRRVHRARRWRLEKKLWGPDQARAHQFGVLTRRADRGAPPGAESSKRVTQHQVCHSPHPAWGLKTRPKSSWHLCHSMTHSMTNSMTHSVTFIHIFNIDWSQTVRRPNEPRHSAKAGRYTRDMRSL